MARPSMSDDMKVRLAARNAGQSPHPAGFEPWSLVTYIASAGPAENQAFERDLKAGCGHPFARKRVW